MVLRGVHNSNSCEDHLQVMLSNERRGRGRNCSTTPAQQLCSPLWVSTTGRGLPPGDSGVSSDPDGRARGSSFLVAMVCHCLLPHPAYLLWSRRQGSVATSVGVSARVIAPGSIPNPVQIQIRTTAWPTHLGEYTVWLGPWYYPGKLFVVCGMMCTSAVKCLNIYWKPIIWGKKVPFFQNKTAL